MLFLYGELIVLLLVSFGLGAALAALAVRAMVKEPPPELVVGAVDTPAAPTAGGGTP